MMLTTRSRSVTQLVRERERLMEENRANMRRKVEPHNPLHAVLEDGAWRDEPCFLIGGGPSLIGFDFERLRGRGRVIAINRALEFVPFADILFFMDFKFYKMCHDDPKRFEMWQSFKGYKVFLNLLGRKIDDCYSMRSLGRKGISGSLKTGLYHGNNSGVGALNLALCLKARPIYLLGYDMRHEKGQSHFHGGYSHRQNERTVQSFINDFESMRKHMKGACHVINLNPKSGLRIFPFGDIDEVLDEPARKSLGDDPPAFRQSVLLGASVAD